MESQSAREAQEALAAVQGARSNAASRLATPWWYHLVLGLLAAVFVVSYTIGGLAIMISVAVVYFLGIGILIGAYRKKTGMWINGLKAGRASWWTVPVMVLMICGMAVAYYFHASKGLDWPAWVVGVVVFIAVNLFGWRFDVALRKQLQEMP